MSRHVDPDDDSFRRSLLRAVAGGLIALVVTFAATGLLTRLGRSDGPGSAAVSLQGLPSAPATELVEPTPTPEPSPTQQVTSPPTPQEATETQAALQSAKNITVQVLDAVGSGTYAADAAEVLRELGYEVVVVNSTPRRVTETTVLASPGHKKDAQQLKRRDPRFAVIGANADFNETVDLHVLVGPDFTTTTG